MLEARFWKLSICCCCCCGYDTVAWILTSFLRIRELFYGRGPTERMLASFCERFLCWLTGSERRIVSPPEPRSSYVAFGRRLVSSFRLRGSLIVFKSTDLLSR